MGEVMCCLTLDAPSIISSEREAKLGN
ncbi:hypothetical protein NSPZN2_40664 [Nitrospira defluvii]|uniref:Uncharacterized protein n=1 Tax=Nitrospira defluvii TaxID=330214 RepID=A0ABM8RYP6_9BACT|nr:hypothetical protein NSPZN2_40664 [Nitrospira defluvii]